MHPIQRKHHIGAWCNSRVGHGLVTRLTRTVRAVWRHEWDSDATGTAVMLAAVGEYEIMQRTWMRGGGTPRGDRWSQRRIRRRDATVMLCNKHRRLARASQHRNHAVKNDESAICTRAKNSACLRLRGNGQLEKEPGSRLGRSCRCTGARRPSLS
jgi:hypothetical protein